jgi:hypothetical protein
MGKLTLDMLQKKQTDPEQEEKLNTMRRKAALVLAFLSVFVFFFKLLFF